MEAKYTKNANYHKNPFIEALPPMLAEDQLIRQLSFYPPYQPNDRLLPVEHRLQKLNNIFEVYQPLPITLNLYHQIYCCLLASFAKKDLHMNQKNMGRGLTLIGISGAGKTTAINQILNLFPKTIEHHQYFDQPFYCHQINYIRVECPHDASVKGICLSILVEFDQLMDSKYYERAIKSRMSVDGMVIQIIRISCWIGLLVVDECQNIIGSKNGILNFLTQLMNEGISVIMLGTPQFLPVLQQQFRLIRRANIQTMGQLSGEEFGLLLQSFWRYQYTKSNVLLTPEMSTYIKEKSHAIPDVMAKIYYYVQAEAIECNHESFGVQDIQKAIRKNMSVIENFIDQLQVKGKRKPVNYDDVVLPQVIAKPVVESIEKNGPSKMPMDDLRSLVKQAKTEGLSVFDALNKSGYVKGLI